MLAGGLSREQAAAEGLDAAKVEALVGTDSFGELVEAYQKLLALPPEGRLRRLYDVALMVLDDEITEPRRATVSAWLIHELERGRDPALELANAIAKAYDRDGEIARAAAPRGRLTKEMLAELSRQKAAENVGPEAAAEAPQPRPPAAGHPALRQTMAALKGATCLTTAPMRAAFPGGP